MRALKKFYARLGIPFVVTTPIPLASSQLFFQSYSSTNSYIPIGADLYITDLSTSSVGGAGSSYWQIEIPSGTVALKMDVTGITGPYVVRLGSPLKVLANVTVTFTKSVGGGSLANLNVTGYQV